METVDHDSSRPISGPAQVAAYLATGEAPQSEATDGLFEITEVTFADQVQTVAEEIERRRTTEGWSYDEFAVVLKDSSSPIQRDRSYLTASRHSDGVRHHECAF